MSRQLRAVGNTTNLEQLVKRTKVLMVVDHNSREVAAVHMETYKLPKLIKNSNPRTYNTSGCIDHTEEHQETLTMFLL